MSKEERKYLTFSYPVERGPQRFRELIIYIARKCESDTWFGATKLNKILYYSDFRAFEKFGMPLTGQSYFRLPKGPAPKALKVYQRQLLEEGAIRVDAVDLGFEKTQHRTIALRNPVLELFTNDEISLVDEVIAELWNQNGTEVSNASHDVRWKVLNDRDDIPYEFAFLSDEVISEEEIARTRELASEYGWVESYGR